MWEHAPRARQGRRDAAPRAVNHSLAPVRAPGAPPARGDSSRERPTEEAQGRRQWEQPRAYAAPGTGGPSLGHRHAPEGGSTMPRRRQPPPQRRLRPTRKTTGRTLQYLDVDYLDATGALINTTKNTSRSQNEKQHKNFGATTPHELVCLGPQSHLPHERSMAFPQSYSTKNANALLHRELRCFDAPYRFHQIWMATKCQMRLWIWAASSCSRNIPRRSGMH